MTLGLKFDPLSWAIGQGLTRALSAATAKTFRKELNDAVEQWAASLDAHFSVHPEAIFRDPQTFPTTDRPALKALHDLLAKEKIPPRHRWTAALLEQWGLVAKRARHGEEVQEFFLKDEDEVLPLLERLSERLHCVCVSQESLFKSSVIEALDELQSARQANARAFPHPLSPDVGVVRLHQDIEAALACRLDLVVVDRAKASLHIWGNRFGKTARDARDKLLQAAMLGANFAHTVFVGLADTRSLPRSDGQGAIGFIRVQFGQAELLKIAESDSVPPGYWESKSGQLPAGDNSPFQQWREIPWREVEEWQ